MKVVLLIVLTILLLAVAVILLGVKVLFVKGGKFPSGHVGDSAALRAKGITCASTDTIDNKNRK
jgi:membrane-associated phospholipid phosphatase